MDRRWERSGPSPRLPPLWLDGGLPQMRHCHSLPYGMPRVPVVRFSARIRLHVPLSGQLPASLDHAAVIVSCEWVNVACVGMTRYYHFLRLLGWYWGYVVSQSISSSIDLLGAPSSVTRDSRAGASIRTSHPSPAQGPFARSWSTSFVIGGHGARAMALSFAESRFSSARASTVRALG
jgi:hypothetical protein